MRIFLGAACVLACWACGSAPSAPTSPGAPTSPPVTRTGTAIIEGIVFHEPLLANRILLPAGPLAGARVTVTEGAAAGATFTTDTNGAYHVELPAGTFRLRWTADFYETRDGDAMTALTSAATKIPTVTLRLLSNVPIPEWTVSGSVADGLGNPVAGASLLSAAGVMIYASGQTGADGNFLLRSTRQHPETLSFQIQKTGYETVSRSVPCVASCTATFNVRLRRLVREYLDGPSSMQVGEVAPVDYIRVYDDGSVDRWRAAALMSNNPSVLQRQELTAPYEHVFVKALAGGTATLTYGSQFPLPVRVDP
jgi:hypothetical protein